MTVYNVNSYSSAQAAQNALQSNGGGKLYTPSRCNLSSSLIISPYQQTMIEGDGVCTGFNNSNAAGNTNILQIGTNGVIGCYFSMKNLSLTNLKINNVTPSHVTGAILFDEQFPYFDSIQLDGVETGFWVVSSWAVHCVNVELSNISGLGVGFDASTPANNFVLDKSSGFSISGPVVALNRGCNGVYITKGDYENISTLIQMYEFEGSDPGNSTIVIAENDIEYLGAELITKTSNIKPSNLSVINNTFGNCSFTIEDVMGGKFEGNTLYNTNVTIKQSSNTNFTVGYNNLLGTSSITIT